MNVRVAIWCWIWSRLVDLHAVVPSPRVRALLLYAEQRFIVAAHAAMAERREEAP